MLRMLEQVEAGPTTEYSAWTSTAWGAGSMSRARNHPGDLSECPKLSHLPRENLRPDKRRDEELSGNEGPFSPAGV